MNQSTQEWQLFLCGLAFALVVFVGFGNPVNSEGYSRVDNRLAPSGPRYVYSGATHDYATTPHVGSLTYSGRGGSEADAGVRLGRAGVENVRERVLTIASDDTEQDRTSTVIK